MSAAGAFQAENLSRQTSDQVEHGQEIVTARRDKSGEAGFDREKARRAVAGILETSEGMTLGGLKIKDLVSEGRP
jgi:hypothetical protein